MANTADNDRLTLDAEKNQVMVRTSNFDEHLWIVRCGSDTRKHREPRYRVFDGCGNGCGCTRIIPRDMIKIWSASAEPSRCSGFSCAVAGVHLIHFGIGSETAKPDIFGTARERSTVIVVEVIDAEVLGAQVDKRLDKLGLRSSGKSTTCSKSESTFSRVVI